MSEARTVATFTGYTASLMFDLAFFWFIAAVSIAVYGWILWTDR